MATTVTYVANQYSVPAYGDSGYAQGSGNLSSYLVALATGSLTLSGGTFSLTADANFGASFGLVSLYYKSVSASIATAGVLRLADTDTIDWRNHGGGGNIALSKDTSDNLQWNTTKILLSGAVVNADINAAAAIAYSKLALTGSIVNGDLVAGTLTNTAINASAAIAYSKLALTGSVVNADIASGAAIAYSKLTLTGSIVNADVNASAAIAYSKLALTGAVVPGDLSSGVYTNVTGVGAQTQALNMNTHKVTGVSNGTASTDATAFGQVKLIQGVSMSTNTQDTTTSSTYQASSLTLAITPSSSSNKVKITVSGAFQTSFASSRLIVTIFRGSTDIGDASFGFMTAISSGTTLEGPVSICYVDSPATTSATTYTVKFKSADNVHSVFLEPQSNKGSLILEEVAY